MTVIVAAEAANVVVMGADSFSGNSSHFHRTKTAKLFRRGRLLIGCSTDWRFTQLMRWKLAPPQPHRDQPIEEYMATVLADAIRSCLSENGYTTKKDEHEQGGSALIALRGELYKLQADFDLTRSADGYTAIGAGVDLALGALALSHKLGDPASVAVDEALAATARHSPWVAPPFVTMDTGP